MGFFGRGIAGGVHLPHLKSTADYETVVMPVPKSVLICMQQHIGSPCVPAVRPGDQVSVGQIIGDCGDLVSAPVHASVSGRVAGIERVLLPSGKWTDSIRIESDGKQTMHPSVKPPEVYGPEDLAAAVRASGLVGLGGAGFPTHVKLKTPGSTEAGDDNKIDTLLINGAECEPYITADYREMMESAEDVIGGVFLIKKLLGIPNAVIAVEMNKPKAIAALSAAARKYADKQGGGKINVVSLRTIYPQGAEKVLVYSCLGRKIPQGGLPSDAGCMMLNVSTAAFIYRYLQDGVPLIKKRVTVDGSAMIEPKNVMVPIGASLDDVIKFCGGYKAEPGVILVGGPMMGMAMYTRDMPLLKPHNGLLAIDRKDSAPRDATECLRCGRCAEACPMRLRPSSIENKVKDRNVTGLKQFSVGNCIECGCCAFVCPARRRLVQYMRLGKKMSMD